MPRYKVTLVYGVAARSKAEAVAKLTVALKDGTAVELREYESVKEVLGESTGGWTRTLRKQVTGM